MKHVNIAIVLLSRFTSGQRKWEVTEKGKADLGTDQPIIYQIRIKGVLEEQWSEWFDGMTITLTENGETVLTGPVVDQPALHGLLKKVRDLGIPLISVNPSTPDQAESVSQNTTPLGQID